MQTEREETRVNETREVLIFACNWLREWREFLGQSQSGVKQNQAILNYSRR